MEPPITVVTDPAGKLVLHKKEHPPPKRGMKNTTA
jgi:hypothetical protein